MDEAVERFRRLGELMNERIRSRTPQERDRMMQQFLAQTMTPEQKFRTVGMLMNFVLKRGLLEVKDEHGG